VQLLHRAVSLKLPLQGHGLVRAAKGSNESCFKDFDGFDSGRSILLFKFSDRDK
jgi:hypothetical protein